MGTEENNITKRIKEFLTQNNIWHVKYFANSYTKKGIPDILACVNGLFVGIEVKTDKGKLSPMQLYQAQEILNSQGYWFCVRPNNFEQFKNDIKNLLDK